MKEIQNQDPKQIFQEEILKITNLKKEIEILEKKDKVLEKNEKVLTEIFFQQKEKFEKEKNQVMLTKEKYNYQTKRSKK